MPAKTGTGLPYPLGTDPVRDGDNTMQALAEAVDAQWRRGDYIPTTNAQGGFIWPLSPPFAGPPICVFTDGDASGSSCRQFGVYQAGSNGAQVAVQVFELDGTPAVNATVRVLGMFWGGLA